MKEARICLCRDTMKRLFKHLQRSKSGRNLWKVILFRTKDQFPMKKPKRMTKTNNPRDFDSLKDDPNLDLKAIENIRKELKTKRKKRRTPKQIRATKKLIAFNKRRRLRR